MRRVRQKIFALIGIIGLLIFLGGLLEYFRFESIPHEKSFYYLWGHVTDTFWEVQLPLILVGLTLILCSLVFFVKRKIIQSPNKEENSSQRFFIFSSGEFKLDEMATFLGKAATVLNLDHQFFVLFDSYDSLKRDLTAEQWKQLHHQGHEVIHDRDLLFYNQPGAFAQDAEKLFSWSEPLLFFNYPASLAELKQNLNLFLEHRQHAHGIPSEVLEQVLPALANNSGLITLFAEKSNDVVGD